MAIPQTRRRVLATMALAGVANLLHVSRSSADEGSLETTSVRLRRPGLCVSSLYIAEELLRADGFTDIRYIDEVGTIAPVASGRADFSSTYASEAVQAIDAGETVVLLTGMMGGCFELFAREDIRSIAGLKGRTVGVQGAASFAKVLVTMMAAQVGLDPAKDIRWVVDLSMKPIEQFIDGKIDAFLGFPPEPQELRARHFGRILVNTSLDRPWSEYFCCMLAARPDYVRAYPNATKRVVRAILKATDLCATEPTRVARQLASADSNVRYDYALQTLNENHYDKWRESDPDDTIRWYALRLHEVGFVKSSPQKIIAAGTDWRFLNQLKRELKT